MKAPFAHRWFILFLWVGIAAQTKPVQAATEFNSAIDQILERSTAVEISRAQLESTLAMNIPTRWVWLPTVSLDAQRSRIGGYNNSYSAGVTRQFEGTSQWNLFRFGADYEANVAANSQERAGAALVSNQILSIEQAAVNALTLQIQNRLELEVYSRMVEVEKGLLDIARARFARGMLADQEVSKVEIDLQNAKARLANAQIAETKSRSELEALLGSADVSTDWPWKARLDSVSKSHEFPWDKFEPLNHPSYQAAAESVSANSALASSAWRKALPSLDFSGALGSYDSGSGRLTYGWSSTVAVSWSLFDHFSNYSTARVTQIAREIADQTQVETARAVLANYQTASQSFKIALESAISREKVRGLALRLYDDNRTRFEGGRIDANELSVELNRLLDSEIFSIEGWSAAHQQFSQICHSIGRRVRDCGV